MGDLLKIETYNKHFRNLNNSYTLINCNKKLRTIMNGDSGLNSFYVVPYTVEVSSPYFPHNLYNILKWALHVNLLNPTGHGMHQKFNIQQLYVLPTPYLCVLYLSENKQRLVPLTA